MQLSLPLISPYFGSLQKIASREIPLRASVYVYVCVFVHARTKHTHTYLADHAPSARHVVCVTTNIHSAFSKECVIDFEFATKPIFSIVSAARFYDQTNGDDRKYTQLHSMAPFRSIFRRNSMIAAEHTCTYHIFCF